MHHRIDFYKAQKLFKENGMCSESVSMHMVFTGNPGSAKTTVARLFASIMKENGILSIGDLYEVGRADLVGKYVGWTARIVREKFSAAKGSVLFIDEAYSLSDGQYNTFGDEAINTIVQEMENNREDIIVIFAGYPEQMQDFLNRNPGLRSRIAFNVNFEDYNPKELYDITKLIAKKKGLVFSPGTEEKIMPIFEHAVKTCDFGNGRFARNIIEKARLKQAQRLIKMDIPNVSCEEIKTLLPEDFEVPEIHTPSINKIGF